MAFVGTIIKKYTEIATKMKAMVAFAKLPMRILPTLIALKSGLPKMPPMIGVRDVFDEGCDHGSKSGAHNDTDCEVKHVTAKNEVPKAFQHFFLPHIFSI